MKKLLLIASVFFMALGTMLAQERTIQGTITDANGEPLIGASIIVKGTTSGTVTDVDGSYSLKVPEGSMIVVSYTGFTTQELALSASNVMDVTLQEGLVLDEVVVTAHGIEKEKRALGYSVGTVSGEELERIPGSDVSRMLKGKVAGLNITSTSGVSGTGTNIILRGYSSLTGSNQPLFIVDGVPFNISTNKDNGTNDFLEGGQSTSSRFLDIDPNNIESVSVLKGLSASVLYGENGRNGVILITTKNGAAGGTDGKLAITVDQSYYKTEIASLPDYQTNYGGGFHQNFGFFFSNWGPHFDRIETVNHPLSALTNPALKAQFPEYQDLPYNYQNYNSVENFFQDGYIYNSSINIKGGTDKASFSGTFGYSQDEGFTPGNTLEKINVGVGGQVKLSNKFRMNTTINFVQTDMVTPPISYSDGSGIWAGGGISVFSDVFYTPRSVDLMGLPFQAPATNGAVYYRSGNDILNPRWTVANAGNISEVQRVYGQSGLTYEATDWLSLTYRFGIDTYTERQEYFVNKMGLGSNDYAHINNGLYRTSDIRNTIWDHNAFAGLKFENIAPDLDMTARIGFNYRQDRFDRDGLESTNQLVFGFIEHSNFTNHTSINSFSGLDLQFRSLERLMAMYGEVTFDYRNYLYLNIQARNDWSSTVEPDNRSLFYPSASLSFIPTELMDDTGILDYLKVRLGYGTSAGFPNPYSTRNTLSAVAKQFVDRNGNIITTNSNATFFEDNGAGSTLGNPNLKPELHKELEFGIDAKLWNNRIGVDLTLYRRITEDLITRAPLEPATGYTSTFFNIGEIENKGVEIGLDVTPVRVGNFQWNLYGNFYAYQSIVNKLGQGLSEVNIAGFTNLGNFAEEGEPFGIIKGTAIARTEDGTPIIDGDGYFLHTDTIQRIGNPHPDFVTSITNNLSWKGLNFSFQFDYRKGGDMYSGSARALLSRGLTKDTDFDRTQAFLLEGVIIDNDGNEIPNTTMITATNLYFDNYGFGPSEMSVFDATTVRLREVSLSYTLPKTLLDASPFGEITVSLSGYNLWYKAINFPEHTNVDTDALGFGADGNGLGFEFLNGPSARRYGASLRVKF